MSWSPASPPPEPPVAGTGAQSAGSPAGDVPPPLVAGPARAPVPQAIGNKPGAGAALLTAVLGGQLVVVLAFCVLGIVAVWLRATTSNERPRGLAGPTEPAEPSGPTPSTGRWVAVVAVGNAAYQSGVLREQPSMSSAKVAYVPLGSVVDVLDPYDGQRVWFRVRTRGTAPKSGWMHRDLLRRQ